MKLRASLFLMLCCWFLYEAKFSPSYFVSQVQFSLAELQSSLDNALEVKHPIHHKMATSGDPLTISALD